MSQIVVNTDNILTIRYPYELECGPKANSVITFQGGGVCVADTMKELINKLRLK